MSTPDYTPPIRIAYKVTTPAGGEDVVLFLEDAVRIICEDTGYEVTTVHATDIVYEVRVVRTIKSDPPQCDISDSCPLGLLWGRYAKERDAEDALGLALAPFDHHITFDEVIYDFALLQVEVFTDGHNTPVPESDITSVKVRASKVLTPNAPPKIIWHPKD